MNASTSSRSSARDLGTEHRMVRLGGEEDAQRHRRSVPRHGPADDRRAQHVLRLPGMARRRVDGGAPAGSAGTSSSARLRQAVPATSSRAVTLGYWAGRLPRGKRSRGLPASQPAARQGGSAWKLGETLRRSPTLTSMYLLRRELFLAAERRALHALPSRTDAQAGMSLTLMRELEALTSATDAETGISALETAHYLRSMLLRDGDGASAWPSGSSCASPPRPRRSSTARPTPGPMEERATAEPKPLLLDAVGPRLPSSVYLSRKRGFTFPWQAWLLGALRDRAQSALADQDVWRTIGLEAAVPAQMWGRFLDGDPACPQASARSWRLLGARRVRPDPIIAPRAAMRARGRGHGARVVFLDPVGIARRGRGPAEFAPPRRVARAKLRPNLHGPRSSSGCEGALVAEARGGSG